LSQNFNNDDDDDDDDDDDIIFSSFFIFQFDEVKIDATPFTFYNLKSLELSTPFTAMNPIVFVFRLLRSSPNLEKLKIQVTLNVAF